MSVASAVCAQCTKSWPFLHIVNSPCSYFAVCSSPVNPRLLMSTYWRVAALANGGWLHFSQGYLCTLVDYAAPVLFVSREHLCAVIDLLHVLEREIVLQSVCESLRL